MEHNGFWHVCDIVTRIATVYLLWKICRYFED